MHAKVELFKALGDETRLQIVHCILKSERSVSEIVHELKKPQPTISLALRVLLQANVIKSRREGKFIYYSLANDSIKKIIEVLEQK